MSTIAGIIKAKRGSAGHDNHWVVIQCAHRRFPESDELIPAYALTHYGVSMVVWLERSDGLRWVEQVNIGRGSVSDQNGVNKALRALGFWGLYFSRVNGAHIRVNHPLDGWKDYAFYRMVQWPS